MRIQRHQPPFYKPCARPPRQRVQSAKVSLSQELELFFIMPSDASLRVAILEVLQGKIVPGENHIRALGKEILALPRFNGPDCFSRPLLIRLKAQKRKVFEIIVPNVLHEEGELINPSIFNVRNLTQKQETDLDGAKLACLKFNFVFLLALAKTVNSRALALELCSEFEILGESEAALLQTAEMACFGFATEITYNPLVDFLGNFPALRSGFFKPVLPTHFGVFGFINHLFKLGLWYLRRMVR